jgi:hypothetical protein
LPREGKARSEQGCVYFNTYAAHITTTRFFLGTAVHEKQLTLHRERELAYGEGIYRVKEI